MISLENYLQNPCSSSSIPYWKAKNISIPDNMKIVHDGDFSTELLKEYEDETYFRLHHSMKKLTKPEPEDYDIVTASLEDIETIVSVINGSYTDLQVNKEQIQSYTKTLVYRPELWILIKESATKNCVGCGIADFDAEAEELILEWIQVLPQYRGKNIGAAIVKELLWRGREYAKFATVSGKVENKTKPEVLYRKCGFIGNDVWHILRK